jgi:hypothetical protein
MSKKLWSDHKKTKSLTEGWRGFLAEEADPAKLDSKRFPLELSDVAADQEDAVADVTLGDEDKSSDDDKISVTPNFTAPVSKLRPSQSSMNIGKAMGMALSMIYGKMKAGGDLGAFISSDGHIMDGHHRWVATGMVDPSKEIGGYMVDFPGKELIAVLNAITVGKLGIQKGKPGTGGFDQFKEGPIRNQLEKMKGGTKHLSAEQIQQALEKFTGVKGEAAAEAAVKKFVDNLSNLKFAVPSGAPARPDMPVIDNDIRKGATATAVKALAKGEVDVNPPYAKRQKYNTQTGMHGSKRVKGGRLSEKQKSEK